MSTRDRTAPANPTVAVIGGGFSGLLTAIHLLHADPDLIVRLVERAPQFARGRAYGTENPDHLLNVRVANMSAFPDRPDHFSAWLRAQGDCDGPNAFVSRRRYGDYLQSLLRERVRDPDNAGRLLLEHDEAVAIRPTAVGHRIRLALGRSFEATAVVLAVGLGAPARLPQASPDVMSVRTYVGDPWRGDLEGLPHGEILILGSGLSMVDVALSLDRPGRSLLALSRHGLPPRTHGPAPPAPAPQGRLDTPRQALRTLRRHAESVGWRSAVDSIRPATTAIWRSWSALERRRFLRHLLPWWDVHRHRVSDTVATRLARAVGDERLAVLAGRLEALEPIDGGFAATIRLRGRPLAVVRRYQAVVNCTGLSGDLRSSRLLDDLHEQGLARQDAFKLGLDVEESGQLVGRDGILVRGLFAVGPLTRSAFWETIAVPDLRNQTADVARAVRGSLGL